MAAAPRLELVAIPGIPRIEPGDDVADLISRAMVDAGVVPEPGDVVVVAQKIVSKAEDRYVRLADVQPSPQALELSEATGKDARFLEVVLAESEAIVKCRRGVVIAAHRLGFVMANAGIDQSNIEHGDGSERVLLLPRDPDGAARDLKAALEARFKREIGVIINDSFGRAWRSGVVGVALGAAGVPSLVSQVGVPDLFGRTLRSTEIAIADEIAAAASLLMGQAGEGLPVVLARGVKIAAAARPAAALVRPRHEDMFR